MSALHCADQSSLNKHVRLCTLQKCTCNNLYIYLNVKYDQVARFAKMHAQDLDTYLPNKNCSSLLSEPHGKNIKFKSLQAWKESVKPRSCDDIAH